MTKKTCSFPKCKTAAVGYVEIAGKKQPACLQHLEPMALAGLKFSPESSKKGKKGKKITLADLLKDAVIKPPTAPKPQKTENSLPANLEKLVKSLPPALQESLQEAIDLAANLENPRFIHNAHSIPFGGMEVEMLALAGAIAEGYKKYKRVNSGFFILSKDKAEKGFSADFVDMPNLPSSDIRALYAHFIGHKWKKDYGQDKEFLCVLNVSEAYTSIYEEDELKGKPLPSPKNDPRRIDTLVIAGMDIKKKPAIKVYEVKNEEVIMEELTEKKHNEALAAGKIKPTDPDDLKMESPILDAFIDALLE